VVLESRGVLTLSYRRDLFIFEDHQYSNVDFRSFFVTGGTRSIATCQGREFSGTGRRQGLEGLRPVQTCANTKTVAMTSLLRCPVSNHRMVPRSSGGQYRYLNRA